MSSGDTSQVLRISQLSTNDPRAVIVERRAALLESTSSLLRAPRFIRLAERGLARTLKMARLAARAMSSNLTPRRSSSQAREATPTDSLTLSYVASSLRAANSYGASARSAAGALLSSRYGREGCRTATLSFASSMAPTSRARDVQGKISLRPAKDNE